MIILITGASHTGKTALMYAREYGHTGVEAVLLQAGAVEKPDAPQEEPAQNQNKNMLDSLFMSK